MPTEPPGSRAPDKASGENRKICTERGSHEQQGVLIQSPGFIHGVILLPTEPPGFCLLNQCRPATQDELISQLIPQITGWCNYDATVCSKDIFAQLDHKVWEKLFRGWGKFRHPKKSGRWIAKKYWRLQKGEGWTFGNGNLVLPKHSNTKINRHPKVREDCSPDDGNWTYWSKRKGEYPGVSKRVTITIKKQKGKCAESGLNFLPDDLVEIHHKNGNYRDNRFENLTAVHLHCHDQIHGGIGNLSTQLSIHDKEQLGEEPDERKLSRPVLKPSMGGDLHA